MKWFVYPTGGQGAASKNPYIQNMKQALGEEVELVQPNYKKRLPRMLVFLLSSTKADAYIFNWIENSSIGRSGFRGALMSLLGLWIVKMRRAKIVWIFHNIHPHSGETFWTRKIKRFMFKHSSLIIAHSQEAVSYAQQYAKCRVVFKHHPMKRADYGVWKGIVQECDLYYWGAVTPYKGVYEFLSCPRCHSSGKSINVVGKCDDSELDEKISNLAYDNVTYENRAADFGEIAAQCKKAKYVVFPYIGDSISSSGVLMDTLLMGGTPVGPNRGAFADLAALGCCITYEKIDEVFSLPVDDAHRLRLNPEKVDSFIEDNSWASFAKWLSMELSV